MATKTTVGIKFTKKPKTERATLNSEEKLTGPEPEWTGTETGNDFGQEYAVKLRRSMFYANHHYSLKDIKKDVLRYVDSLEAFSKEEMRLIGGAYDSKTSVSIFTASSMCRAGQRGAPLIEAHREYIVKSFKELLDKYIEIKAPDVKKAGAEVYKPTIQDRLNEKLSEYIGHIEGVYDEVIMGGKKVSPGTFDYFKINEVPQMQINKISNHFQKYIAELTEAQAGEDPQLKEGYSHFKAADFKRHVEFLNNIVSDCDSYYKIKQVTRKARVVKAPSKEKQVAKMKFLAEDKLLRIASISPVDIIGATELWVYNSRTRKIGRYVADEYSKTLNVKGTTITGFQESISMQKTLRKPDIQIKDFMKLGKIQAKKFLDTVKTTETLMNGRINSDTLLLKVL
jgi:hypothetical protein